MPLVDWRLSGLLSSLLYGLAGPLDFRRAGSGIALDQRKLRSVTELDKEGEVIGAHMVHQPHVHEPKAGIEKHIVQWPPQDGPVCVEGWERSPANPWVQGSADLLG